MSVGRSLNKAFFHNFSLSSFFTNKNSSFSQKDRSIFFFVFLPWKENSSFSNMMIHIYTQWSKSTNFFIWFQNRQFLTKLYPFVFCILKQASALCRCGLTCKPLRSGPGLILWWFVIPETSPCHPTTGPTHADLFSPPSQMVRLLTIVSRWSWWSGWLRWCESDS